MKRHGRHGGLGEPRQGRAALALVMIAVVALIAAACGQPSAAPPSTSAPPPSSLPASLLDTAAASETLAVGDDSEAPGDRPLWSSFEADDECPFSVPTGTEPECGWLVAPQLRRSDGPSRAEVRIPVAIFRATGPDPQPDPVFYLHGGPGSGALTSFSYFADSILEPFNAERDVVVFDQRGAGLSEPSLECRWYTLLDAQSEIPDQATLRAESIAVFDECADDLTLAGVDLTAYNSLSNAADIEDLRRVLGYEHVNLYGVSYGTRLAQTVMREFPWAVRSVILDSAYPTDVDLTLSMPANFRDAMDRVLARCAAEVTCASAYPDLAAALDRVAAGSESAPLVVNGRALKPTGLALVLFSMLYDEATIALIPGFVTDIDAGSNQLFDGYLRSTDSLRLGGVGPFITVMCAEEVPFSGPGLIPGSRTGIPLYDAIDAFPDGRGPGAFDACDAWRAAPVDPIENQPVEITMPTLVLAGELDPITPARWGEALAEPWEQATYLELAGQGHGVIAAPCAASRVAMFVEDPTLPIDTVCETSTDPIFATPATWSDALDRLWS